MWLSEISYTYRSTHQIFDRGLCTGAFHLKRLLRFFVSKFEKQFLHILNTLFICLRKSREGGYRSYIVQ